MRESTFVAFRPDIIADHVRPPEYAGLVERARHRRRRHGAIAGAAALVVVAAVAVPVLLGRVAQRDAVDDRPVGSGHADFDRRAGAMIDAWREGGLAYVNRLGFVPVHTRDRLTFLPQSWPTRPDGLAEWETLTPSAPYQAFLAGRFRLDRPLSSEPMPAGVVTVERRSPIAVPVASAAVAYEALDRADPAPDCTGDACLELTVTGATLGRAPVVVLGEHMALVPAWLFTVREVDVPIARVAIAATPDATAALRYPLEIVGPPADARWSVTVDKVSRRSGNRVEYRFMGGMCDETVTPAVYETPDVVVVGVHIVATQRTCQTIALSKTAEVTLARPLGNRAVLTLTDGFPVIVL